MLKENPDRFEIVGSIASLQLGMLTGIRGLLLVSVSTSDIWYISLGLAILGVAMFLSGLVLLRRVGLKVSTKVILLALCITIGVTLASMNFFVAFVIFGFGAVVAVVDYLEKSPTSNKTT
jgi:hypothetical protein